MKARAPIRAYPRLNDGIKPMSCLDPHDAILHSQRLALHYVAWGGGDAPPLIVVHGGRDHCRSWDEVARDFGTDRQVIAPDLRGHGASAWPSDGGYTLTDFVFDLAELIAAIGAPQVDLIGHSLGGNIALRFTAIFPEKVRKLVVIEGLGPSPAIIEEDAVEPVSSRLRRWIETRRVVLSRTPRSYKSFEDALARMRAVNPQLSEENSRHLAVHAVRTHFDGSVSFRFDPALAAICPIDLSWEEKYRLWGEITCSVLLLYGSKSFASNPADDGRAEHFRDAQVEVCEGAGHWLHQDNLPWFLSKVRAFLA